MQRDLTICKHWKNFKSGNPHQRLHKMLSKVKNLKQNIDFSIVWYVSWLGWSTFGLVCFSWHGIYLMLRKKYCCYKLSKVTKWQLFSLTLVFGKTRTNVKFIPRWSWVRIIFIIEWEYRDRLKERICKELFKRVWET